MKKRNDLKDIHPLYVIFGSLILLWMVLLTAFTIWAWNQHIWQAQVDSEIIYKLLVDNANQQVTIDELGK
ncbi:MAG: hypothetical protein V4611_04470 [Patescibacteria group bacterium]